MLEFQDFLNLFVNDCPRHSIYRLLPWRNLERAVPLGEAGLHWAADAARREVDILEWIFTFSRRRDLPGGAEMEMEDQVEGPVVAGLRRSRVAPPTRPFADTKA